MNWIFLGHLDFYFVFMKNSYRTVKIVQYSVKCSDRFYMRRVIFIFIGCNDSSLFFMSWLSTMQHHWDAGLVLKSWFHCSCQRTSVESKIEKSVRRQKTGLMKQKNEHGKNRLVERRMNEEAFVYSICRGFSWNTFVRQMCVSIEAFGLLLLSFSANACSDFPTHSAFSHFSIDYVLLVWLSSNDIEIWATIIWAIEMKNTQICENHGRIWFSSENFGKFQISFFFRLHWKNWGIFLLQRISMKQDTKTAHASSMNFDFFFKLFWTTSHSLERE